MQHSGEEKLGCCLLIQFVSLIIPHDELMCVIRCPKVKVPVKNAQQPSAAPVDKGLLADAASSKDVTISTTAETAAVNDSGSKCVLQEDKSNGVDDENEVRLMILWVLVVVMTCVVQKTPLHKKILYQINFPVFVSFVPFYFQPMQF